jgi:hypothetical protein
MCRCAYRSWMYCICASSFARARRQFSLKAGGDGLGTGADLVGEGWGRTT